MTAVTAIAQAVRATDYMLSHALRYAELGIAVFPVYWVRADGSCGCGKAHPDGRSIGKHPITPNGSTGATTDPNVIRKWWKQHPFANIAAVPSKCNPPMIVLDFDPRNGSDATKAELEAQHGKFPRLIVCITGGGGEHLWFLARAGAVLPGKLGPGIDVQHNGYVILPPSLHKSGQRYEWLPDRSLLNDDDREFLQPLPRWIAETRDTGTKTVGESTTEVDPLAGDGLHWRGTPADVARLKSALQFIDPDRSHSRDDYRTVLFGCHAAGGHELVEEIARPWARGDFHGIVCESYDERTFNSDIRKLDNGKSKNLIGLGSIYKIAKDRGWPDPRQTRAKATNAAPAEGVSIQCAANIEPESISWAWLYWLALRKLAVLAGQAGTGKTTIATSCAAIVSNAGTWPDGTRSPRGSVLIWSGEDDPKDTLVPRLIAAGADLSRIHFVGTASDGTDSRPFDPSRDMPALQERAARIGDILLVIVDPIVAAVAGDSHKNAEVRRGLAPLVNFAETIGAALLGISHFSKGTGGRDPLERVTGSVAFGAVARVVWVTAATENEDGERMHVLARAKSNIGPDDGGFSYSFKQVDLPSHPGITASKVEWGTPLVGRARDLLAEREEPKPGKKTETVFEWLQALLQDGPVRAKDVQAQAAAAGHAWRTVERAKSWLGVVSRRCGTGNRAPFEWHLPALDDGDEL